MQAILVKSGSILDYTPAAAVSAGDVVVQGALVGIATRDIAALALGALETKGAADIVQAAVTFAVGGGVYWDADGNPVGGTAGTGAATTSATGNTFCGYALEITAATDTTIRTALRSVEASAAESLSLADLGDVGTVIYTAGRLIIADGDSYEDQALTGRFALDGAGLLAQVCATKTADGSTQSNATAITAEGLCLVAGADATKGVKLPAAAAGKTVTVKNGAAAVLKVWPNTDDAINAIAANTNIAMAANTCATFHAYDATTWYTVPLLPS